MVSGASKGLGLAVARALASEGARMSIVSRDRDAIESAGRQIEKESGGEVLALPATRLRGRHSQLHRATVERFGGADPLC